MHVFEDICFFVAGFIAGVVGLWRFSAWWTHRQYRVLMKIKEDAKKDREQG